MLRDAICMAQVSLLIMLATFGGLNWRAAGALAGVTVVMAVGWFVAFPQGYHSMILAYLVNPEGMLLIPFLAARWLGFRGSWTSEEKETPPWQISIRVLLATMAAVAVSLSMATWLRRIPWIAEWGTDTRAWLVTTILLGGTDALICLTAVWAIGTRGAGIVKFLILICTTVFLAGWQLYSLRMDMYWQYAAFTSVVWAAVIFATLTVWRLCGWHIVRDVRKKPIAL
jgi:hypothetical protein